jgi:hypothetical protein
MVIAKSPFQLLQGKKGLPKLEISMKIEACTICIRHKGTRRTYYEGLSPIAFAQSSYESSRLLVALQRSLEQPTSKSFERYLR